MTKFRELAIGTWFDWIDPAKPSHNGFFHPCVKTGPRTYNSVKGMKYRVGSINAEVFNVDREPSQRWAKCTAKRG